MNGNGWFFVAAALVLLLLAGFLLWQARRQRQQTGLPAGRVIYSDTGAWARVEKPLYHAELGLTGKPDYILHQGDDYFPVEVKSTRSPSAPYESHVLQLAAYCALVEHATRRRPPYGIIAYPGRTFAVDYTPELERQLLDLLAEIHHRERRAAPDRSHEEPGRCKKCGFRRVCDQKL